MIYSGVVLSYRLSSRTVLSWHWREKTSGWGTSHCQRRSLLDWWVILTLTARSRFCWDLQLLMIHLQPGNVTHLDLDIVTYYCLYAPIPECDTSSLLAGLNGWRMYRSSTFSSQMFLDQYAYEGDLSCLWSCLIAILRQLFSPFFPLPPLTPFPTHLCSWFVPASTHANL